MVSFRKIAAGLAVAAGVAVAAAPAGASAPLGSFEASNGQVLALTGAAPGHFGSADSLRCGVRAGGSVAAQTSFALVPVSGSRFAVQWENGDGRADSQHVYLSGAGGPAGAVAVSHVIDPSSTWHLSGGQLVNGTGLALALFPGGGAGVFPAGGSQPSTQIAGVSC